MKAKKSISRVILIGGIAVAFVGGYLAARATGGGRQSSSADIQQVLQTGLENGFESNEKRKVIEGRPWTEAKVQLMKRWESSPGVWVDFDLREETQRLLELASNEDLEAWLRDLRSDDEEEDSDWDIQLQIHEMVLRVLAPRAGENLIRSLAEHPLEGRKEDLVEAMDFWIMHDPSAALAWLDGEVPEQIKEDLEYYRQDALEELAAKNPIEFEARLAQVDQDTRENLLSEFAERRANTEGRAEILERAARSHHEEAMALWSGLIKGEGEVNPQLALATLSELQISDADRAKLDDWLLWTLLRGVTLSSHYLNDEDRSGSMQGWLERNFDRAVPSGVLDTFEGWSQSQTEHAVQWVGKLPSGPHFDVFTRSLIRKAAGEQGLDHPTAAKLAARIGDPSLRGEAEKNVKESWQAEDGAAATKWEESLPAADRERLK